MPLKLVISKHIFGMGKILSIQLKLRYFFIPNISNQSVENAVVAFVKGAFVRNEFFD